MQGRDVTKPVQRRRGQKNAGEPNLAASNSGTRQMRVPDARTMCAFVRRKCPASGCSFTALVRRRRSWQTPRLRRLWDERNAWMATDISHSIARRSSARATSLCHHWRQEVGRSVAATRHSSGDGIDYRYARARRTWGPSPAPRPGVACNEISPRRSVRHTSSDSIDRAQTTRPTAKPARHVNHNVIITTVA